MKSRRQRPLADPDLTLGGRLAAAFGSLFFSVPLAALYWLLFNSQVAPFTGMSVSIAHIGVAVVAFALLSFVFPRFAPTVFGWASDLFVGIAKWW
ncbi:hypothetical protein [Lysobacter sp. cf310]|uniref:hypothetical protein n=1 Tax=Lysobacter sp. cf310 TaxID=1761790 RepID=UPI0008EEA169|nr:hypothetical protein [Lysobacter sp. cf310]SFK25968.1 hypothetical protein SAMN04487938_0043 [Lysobacter sp. cf310]